MFGHGPTSLPNHRRQQPGTPAHTESIVHSTCDRSTSGSFASAGQAAETAATGGMSGLLNARRGFSMAKDVIPGKLPERLVGGSVADKLQAAGPVADKLKARAIEQLKDPSKGMTQAIFEPSSNAGAVLKTAEPLAGRHEVVHGLVNNAYQTGEMAGLPFPIKAAATLQRMGGGANKGIMPAVGYAADELAAHALENRGLLEQLRGAGRFLFKPGANHDFYAREFSDISPLVGALYGQLPNAPRYAAGLGAAGLGGGALGAYAYGSSPDEER